MHGIDHDPQKVNPCCSLHEIFQRLPEARRMFAVNTGQSSFAGITSFSKDKTIADLQTQVAALSTQMAEKDAKIKSLEAHASIGTSASDNEEFRALKNLVEELKSQVESRDLRIQALEEQTRKDSRLETVRKHGTIEDLVARVAALEASTVRKDEEIMKLRKENEDFRKIISHKALGKYQQKQAAKEQASSSTSVTKHDIPKEKSNSKTSTGTPKAKGAIPKTKKTLEKQSNQERDPKITKEDDGIMEISDEEGSLSKLALQQILRNGSCDISDEGAEGEDETEPVL